jgi:Glycosyl transferase family 2
MKASRSADVRVYLFTYRRNNLLRRAVESLLQQTHSNWVCELHNDDPDDSFPEHLVAEIDDPRIKYVRHEKNWGAVRTFNLAFRQVSEPFISILEDDNWWENEFLGTMLRVMDAHPQVSLSWANMWKWREGRNGSWEKEGTIWPFEGEAAITLFEKPDPRGICDALHSQGAMLLRSSTKSFLPVPETLPVFAIEPVRERAFAGPFLLYRKPIANFSITNGTARAETADQNMQILVILAQSFLMNVQVSDEFYRCMWLACTGALGHKHRALIVAAIKAGRLRRILRGARLVDLLLVLAWALRHPSRFRNLFNASDQYPDVSRFLDAASRYMGIELNYKREQNQS